MSASRKKNHTIPEDNLNNIPPAQPFKIAIAGQGPLLLRLSNIIASGAFKSAMPSVAVSALLLYEKALLPEYQLPELQNINIYQSAKELFAKERDLRLVLNAYSGPAADPGEKYQLDLRRHAPAGVNLLNPGAASFICNAIEKDALTLDGGARIRSIRHSFFTLINQMEEEIFVLDNAGRVIDANTFFIKNNAGMLENYLGKACAEIIGKEYCCTQDGNTVCLWEKPAEQRETFSKVYNVLNAEGQIEYFRAMVVPLPPDGDNNLSLLIRNNITSVMRMEQKLQQSQNMAAIGELSTYIAHEIRNPLFAIGGFANALLRTPSLDNAAREKAKIILEESQRLDGILKSIINFARPSYQDISDMDVAAILRQTIELMALGDAERHIRTTENIAPGLPHALGNAEQLKQGIINIIKNAQEAMPQGGSIDISAAHKRRMIEINIRDTGIGIAREQQDKIFSPFYSTKGKGAGLGLAMTKKYIEEMGGQLCLQSAPGQGTTLTIRLQPALAAENPTVSITKHPITGTSITVKISSDS
ncbi:MAG: PAS domain-containing sensor histidine kinase [Deltaproteobacteria bacterium]|jgi:signal transduction histidine kinase|nr:PAS domain-containing sensor histidine kinase [Deltaproteobacteria bacterium]